MAPATTETRARRLLIAAGVAFVLPWQAALASGLRLSPLRLDLSAQQKATQLELTNISVNPVAVQVRAFKWRQDQGQDVYEPTQDIFFAPPIVTVPAQGKVLVRFRLKAAAPKDREGTYRVYFQEVPAADERSVGVGMTFRMRFGVPLFVQAQDDARPALKVTSSRQQDRLRLTLANAGGKHLKVLGLGLYASLGAAPPADARPLAHATHSAAGSNYLLPGTQHEWELPLPERIPAGGLGLLILTDDYDGQAAKGMTSEGRLWLPLSAAEATNPPP